MMLLNNRLTWRRWRAVAGMVAAALAGVLLTACGGAGTPYEPFKPEHIVFFGDESGMLLSNGHKYTVNGLNGTTAAIDCSVTPLWTQYVASYYGKAFAECPGTSTDLTAIQKMTADARVADVAAAVTAYMVGPGLTSSDLVVIAVGMHDVLDQYAQYDGSNLPALEAAAAARGAALAAVVRKAIDSGARVLLTTVPDIGLAPRALAKTADVGNSGDACSGLRCNVPVGRLVNAFNRGLRVSPQLDDVSGAQAGLVVVEDLIRAAANSVGSNGLINATQGVCSVALPDCTTQTLIDGAADKSAQYLWADDLHYGTRMNASIGSAATSLIYKLPF